MIVVRNVWVACIASLLSVALVLAFAGSGLARSHQPTPHEHAEIVQLAPKSQTPGESCPRRCHLPQGLVEAQLELGQLRLRSATRLSPVAARIPESWLTPVNTGPPKV
ncbi:hypothetical protein [Devosia sp.]|uniref:hypothetical protein n=1 Tax=Devosia sp. TaxID=1871048 RepID=UPI002EE3033A